MEDIKLDCVGIHIQYFFYQCQDLMFGRVKVKLTLINYGLELTSTFLQETDLGYLI